MASDADYYDQTDDAMRKMGIDAPNYLGGDRPGETRAEYVDRVDTYSQLQQGGIADSFVAEHNAKQQSNPQAGGPSLDQPKNDGPELG